MSKLPLLVVSAALALLACEGPEGPEGPVGPAGPRGPAGFASGLSCIQSSAGYLFEYELVTYAGGDAIASCAISDGASTYAKTEFLWAGTQGAAQGTCLMQYDLDAISGGFWTFKSDRTVRYTDPSSSAHNLLVSFSPSACSSR